MNLDQLLDYLQQLPKALTEEVQPYTSRPEQLDLNAATQLFLQLDALKDAAAEIEKVANIALPLVSERCRSCIEKLGMDAIEVTSARDGQKFKMSPDEKYRVSVTKANHEAFIDWMLHHPNGRELVKRDVNAASLKKFVVDEVEAGHDVPPFISVFREPSMKVKKVK